VPSLTKKIIRGRSYYYLRECQRIDGKPKIVSQQYLGSAADLVRRLAGPDPLKALVREFGASAAWVDVARQLDVAAIIDRHVPKRDSRGPSVGQYLLIGALNRCLAPRSKSRIGPWFEQTVLPRLLGVRAAQLTSQRFWDNMSRVDEYAIARIERELAQAAVSRFALDLRCLLFDATNFFTFVDSFNLRAVLPQRGHSKEGRDNLRIVGLALLVTADGDIPLLHHCYAGNQHDATTFGDVVCEIARRCRQLCQDVGDITVVFDKGNNSEDNLAMIANAQLLAMIANAQLHFVGSLVPTHHPELLAIQRRQMRRLDTSQLLAVWAYRTKKTVFGIERTVLVTFNRPLYQAQLKTLRREIHKRRRKLERLAASLERSGRKDARGKKPTLAGTRKRLTAILTGRHMKDLLVASVKLNRRQLPKLTWRFNDRAWKHLRTTLLGKTILFTDRHEWTDEQIVRGYRSQAHVESAFRAMKDPSCLTFRPIHHWTDQKLRVHALYCVVALMILGLLRRKVAQAGISLSLARMVERLADIREVSVIYHDPEARSPRLRTVLSDLDTEQQKMLEVLDLTRFRTP
jgi:transposase